MSSSKVSNKRKIIIGIQGGVGSFNEEACRSYCEKNNILKYDIRYLYTTVGVLKALHNKKIDRGMFAIENTLGGTVMETINALSRYNCKILDQHWVNISHTLYAQEGATIKSVKAIMSHPQVFAQCRKTLLRKYKDKKLIVGEGKLVDQSTAARALAEGKLPKSTAVLAPPMCREHYPNLTILDKGLRDKKDNHTLFLFVGRFNGIS